MEKFKEKINQLKLEIDAANQREEIAQKKYGLVSEQLAGKESEVSSYLNKAAQLEDEISKAEQRLMEAKQKTAEGEVLKGQTDSLHRKIQILENAHTKVTNQLKESEEKVKYFENRAQEFLTRAEKAEDERGNFESLNDDIQTKYQKAKKELEETLKSLEDM